MRHGLIATLTVFLLVAPSQAQPVKPSISTNPDFNGKSLDQWIREIEDPDPSVREHAIKMICLMGPAAKRAAPALIRQIRQENDLSPMTNAIIAIGIVNPDDPKHQSDAISALIPMLGSSQGIVRFQAATSLASFGPAARKAIERLCARVNDSQSWEIRRAVCFALGRCGYDESNFPDIRALEALNKGIDDVSKEVRIEALQGLINLGPPKEPQDRQLLKSHFEKRVKVDKDKYAGIWVRVALMRIDEAAINDANIKYIAAYLKKTEPLGINADAARALGAIGPPAKKAIPELTNALKDKDVSLVAWSAWALGRMGPDARQALDALKQLLQDTSDSAIKAAVQEAINAINAPPKR